MPMRYHSTIPRHQQTMCSLPGLSHLQKKKCRQILFSMYFSMSTMTDYISQATTVCMLCYHVIWEASIPAAPPILWKSVCNCFGILCVLSNYVFARTGGVFKAESKPINWNVLTFLSFDGTDMLTADQHVVCCPVTWEAISCVHETVIVMKMQTYGWQEYIHPKLWKNTILKHHIRMT